MTREQVEAEIRRLMDTETDAVRFSNTLFTPTGLFSKLWSTPDEKRALVASPLFTEANRRLSELQRQGTATLIKQVIPVAAPATANGHTRHTAPTEAKS